MINPEDVRNKTFNKSLWGFDTVEVKYFLEAVASEIENLHNKLEEYRVPGLDGKSPEEIIKEANVEAENILREAKAKAGDIINQAEREKEKAYAELSELKIEKMRIIKEIEELIDKLREFVEISVRLDEFEDKNE
ncbi:MAG: DivIVA domain-containing protein [Candidatus Marinimicrobia bacterium]|nr:DivIVA domain-containing protein [Candidatus Neomarinimicrobiota bacterium]